MLESIWKISDLLDIDPFWILIILGLLFLLFVVKCMFPWKPEFKSKKTKDKDGNDVTIHYHLDV